MRYRLYNFVEHETIIVSDDLVDIIRFFNVEYYDNISDCLIQELKGNKYKTIGC